MTIEVKSAAGGLPKSLTSTLSALANDPGGGTIILGLDEAAGFVQYILRIPRRSSKGSLTRRVRSRRLSSSSSATGRWMAFRSSSLASMSVTRRPSRAGSPLRALPTYVGTTGTSHCRPWRSRRFSLPASRRFRPSARRGGDPGDLDSELVLAFLRSAGNEDARGLGRFPDDAELLRRAGSHPSGRHRDRCRTSDSGSSSTGVVPAVRHSGFGRPLPSDPPARGPAIRRRSAGPSHGCWTRH